MRSRFIVRDTASRLHEIDHDFVGDPYPRAALAPVSGIAQNRPKTTQTLLFTEDAQVSTTVNGQVVSSLRGREEIGQAFATFLRPFDTVYHANAQLDLTLSGDTASGVSYCMVTLIGPENGKRMKTSMLVIYNDSYVRQGGRWLITDRKSTS